jgi:branched-chain amino acid transport system substrate-binding protein
LENCEFEAKKVNAQGGVKVGNDLYKINLISEDTKYTAEGGRAAVEKLIFRDKVKFMVGPMSSASAAAAAPIAEENHVIMLPVCSTPKVFTTNTKYIFKMHLPTSIAEFAYPNWLAKEYPSVKTIAVLSVNDETGWATYDYFKLGMKELEKEKPGRLTEVFKEVYERGTTEFTPILTRLLTKKPDIIDMSGASSTEGALMVKQARELGYKGMFFNAATLNLDELVKVAGVENAYGIVHYSFDLQDPPTKELAQYVQEYSKIMGKMPRDIHVFSIDHFSTLLMAIREAQSIDPDKVVAKMESWKTFPSRFGMAKWGGKKTLGVNHQILKPYPLSLIEKGKNIPKGLIAPPELP